MKRYTDENRTVAQEVLALDSIYKFLNVAERISLHNGQKYTDNIWNYANWIMSHDWNSPFMKYPEFDKDQLYFEDHNGDLRPLTEYPETYPQVTESILKL